METALAAHAYRRAIAECPNAVYGLGDPRQWIEDRAAAILQELLAGRTS